MSQKLLRTLAEVADPAHAALIVIDPQHDFCSVRGALAQRYDLDMSETHEAVPRLNALIEVCRASGAPVVWVREVFCDAKMRPNQKARWGEGGEIWLIREDSEGVAWYEGMIALAPSEAVITKWQYDAFEDTDLDLLLQSCGIKTLLMTGFSTNVCVETTARHGYIKGYHIVLVTDCTAASTPAEYAASVHNIKTYFGHAAESAELTALWSGHGLREAG